MAVSDSFGKEPRMLFEAGLSDRAIVLYGWLSARYGGFRAGTFPTVETLARERKRSRRTIERAREELEASGWLRVERRPGRSSVYVLASSAEQAEIFRAHRDDPGPFLRAV